MIEPSSHLEMRPQPSAARRAKYVVTRTMKASGMLRVAGASRWRGDRLLVLGYHGVSIDDEHVFNDELFLSPAVFRSRMEQLRQIGASVLPLTDALDRLRAGTLPPRAVALTFDDGFYDFHRAAWPILREYNFPATVYQTTYYCDHPEPVCHLAWRYILWKARDRRLDLARIAGMAGSFDLAAEPVRTRVFEGLVQFAEARGLSAAAKDELSRALAAELGVDYDELRRTRLMSLMTPEEVREVSDAGVSIELHTHRHRTPVDRSLFLREVDDNQAWIVDVTGRPPAHFCYPSGVWNPAFFPWLAERNIASATTCDLGLATRHSPAYLIPRLIDTTPLAPVEFESWVTGPGSLLRRPF